MFEKLSEKSFVGTISYFEEQNKERKIESNGMMMYIPRQDLDKLYEESQKNDKFCEGECPFSSFCGDIICCE